MAANVVGHFKYHRYEVLFTCDEEAGVATVKYTESGNIRNCTDHTFGAFGTNFVASARSHFEHCVGHAMGYTSRSDIELFVQRGTN